MANSREIYRQQIFLFFGIVVAEKWSSSMPLAVNGCYLKE